MGADRGREKIKIKKGIMILTEAERLCTCVIALSTEDGHTEHYLPFSDSFALAICIRVLFTCLFPYHFPLFTV